MRLLQPGGVRVDRTFDNLSRLVQESGTGAEATTAGRTFGYDLAGRTTSAGDLAFTPNDRGQLIKTASDGVEQAGFSYDGNGRLTPTPTTMPGDSRHGRRRMAPPRRTSGTPPATAPAPATTPSPMTNATA